MASIRKRATVSFAEHVLAWVWRPHETQTSRQLITGRRVRMADRNTRKGRQSLIVGRRDLLRGAAAIGAAGLAPGFLRPAFSQEKPVLVNSIRSLTNPYHATWNKGGAAFA